jgi:hypothetical protein
MFDEFTKWLDEYLRTHEPSAVLKSVVGLVAFASLLGAFFGNQVVRAGAFVVVMFCLMSSVLLLLADRHALGQERDGYLRRLNWHYNMLTELNPGPLIAVELWEQRVEIKANGDVREVLTIEAVAPREHVYFARLTARSLWNQPRRQLRKLSQTVCTVKPDGSLGPNWRIHWWWQGDKLVSYLDLDPPLRRGEVIRFRLDRTWPGKCQPMMRNKQAEAFLLRTTEGLEIRRAEYTLVLPEGSEAKYELIGGGEPDVQLTASDQEKNSVREYTWCAGQGPCAHRGGDQASVEVARHQVTSYSEATSCRRPRHRRDASGFLRS